jgi:diguanylate cyclase (GGDEF)-like protein/PAS domain S-box-containing protein
MALGHYPNRAIPRAAPKGFRSLFFWAGRVISAGSAPCEVSSSFVFADTSSMETTDRADLEERLRDAERRAFEAEAAYETLLGQVPGAIYAYQPELGGVTLAMSSYIEELLGVPADRFLSGDSVWDDVLHPDDRDRAWADYESFLATGQPDCGDYRYVRPDGRVVWIQDRSAMVRDRDGTPLLVQGVMFDITATKELALRMEHMAYHDILTGLPNRAMFQDHLELALARARRHGLAVAVLFLDLDDFKPVNDTHGHEVGDMVLQHAGRRIRDAARDTDLVARQGGDEFLVLLADLEVRSDSDGAEAVVADASDRIARAIAEPADVPVGRLSVHASIGSALFPREAGDARTLLRLADEKMYARKRDRTTPSAEVRRLA